MQRLTAQSKTAFAPGPTITQPMFGGDMNSKGNLKLWSISSEVEDMTHNLADVKSRLHAVFANAEASRH